MIIVGLFGGLGNQMFQYAIGRVTSLKRGTKLSLDYQFLDEGYQRSRSATIRSYELSVFKFQTQETSLFHKNIFAPFISIDFFRNKILGFHHIFNPLFIKEKEYFRYQKIPNRKNLYLFGYWQSYKYLYGFEEIIRRDFEFNKKLNNTNLNILDRISGSNSISLHLRFGDYSDRNILPKEYFKKAINIIVHKVPEARFFVFSNDPGRCSGYLENLNYELVNNNSGDSSYIDLQLMSHCKHNIISKSSFSWWGAWLNPNPDKIVVAPERWYNNSESEDVIPPEWIRI